MLNTRMMDIPAAHSFVFIGCNDLAFAVLSEMLVLKRLLSAVLSLSSICSVR